MSTRELEQERKDVITSPATEFDQLESQKLSNEQQVSELLKQIQELRGQVEGLTSENEQIKEKQQVLLNEITKTATISITTLKKF